MHHVINKIRHSEAECVEAHSLRYALREWGCCDRSVVLLGWKRRGFNADGEALCAARCADGGGWDADFFFIKAGLVIGLADADPSLSLASPAFADNRQQLVKAEFITTLDTYD